MNLAPHDARCTAPSSDDVCMFAFLDAAHALEERLENGLRRVELSLAKHGVLSHLVRASEPLALSELAERMSCVRSNMTQLMDRLEADGLVRRLEDPSDRRVVRAKLTALGEERQAAGAREIEKLQGEFEAMLSERDRVTLDRVLAGLR